MNTVDVPAKRMSRRTKTARKKTASKKAAAKKTKAPLLDKQQVELWEERSKLLRAASHPIRLLILNELSERPHCVKHLNTLVDVTQPQLSQHIAALRNAGLITCHSCGPVRCYYVLRPTLVKQLISLLSEEHIPVEMNCDEIIALARQAWEEDMGGPCEED